MSTLALPVSMHSFQRLIQLVSSSNTICVRGRHAVGKSEGVYQGAALRRSEFYRDPENCRALVRAMGGSVPYLKASNRVTEWNYNLGVPVLERRLSQMTEGDIIGLPVLDAEARSTQFKPCDWLIQACEFPVVLFLDERNRALEGVKQAVFQLADSKIFYGNILNPDTMILIAENIGDAYTVNQSDPAEISRAATVELAPSVEEWLEYATSRCNSAMVEFLRQNPKCVEHTGVNEPNKKYPDRRVWFKLDEELSQLGLYDNAADPMFYVLTGAFCGTEVASLFKKFVLERERQVGAAEVLDNWERAHKRLGKNVSSETYIELMQKVSDHLAKVSINKNEAINVAQFMFDVPGEARMRIWNSIIHSNNMTNINQVMPYVGKLIAASAIKKDTSDIPRPELPPGVVHASKQEPGVESEGLQPKQRKPRGSR
jgi:hypothetical protein